ncbi:hypothetical protein [Capnocytophaga canimorsus]|uniref:hypothetical protein n=1 Tax=Capnocytophaga canimorsus TaxID=28188 RepID=UPI0015623416|nr:hypothetical protein [Capnocytophaga canimorsus]
MKSRFLWVFFLLFSGNIIAQTDYEQVIKASKRAIDSIMEAEKSILKDKFKAIDQMLDSKEINKETAQRMKKEATNATRSTIQNKVRPETQKITEAIRQKADNDRQFTSNQPQKAKTTNHSQDELSLEYEQAMKKLDSLFNEKPQQKPIYESTQKVLKSININIGCDEKNLKKCDKRDLKRIRGGLNFALAFHNMRSNEHFSNDKFRIWGSKSVEIGYYNNVRLLKDNNLLHLNYGLSWMMNKLKMKDSDYFVNNNGITEIQPYKVPVIKSKFKTHYLILPMNLELDFTPICTYEDKKHYPIHKSFRVGVGAYAGLLLNSKQKVKYRASGSTHKELNFNRMNVNEWIYGVSAHIGIGSGVFYARYSLVPLFRNNPTNEYPFSIGMRWGG